MPNKSVTKRKLSSKQERDLDIEIGFLEGVVRRDPDYVEALQVLGDDYTQRGKLEEGLVVDIQLSRLRPEDALVHYNLGCSYALTGQFERAVGELDRAITLGYRDFKWMARDPDLKLLRRHRLYKQIKTRIQDVLLNQG